MLWCVALSPSMASSTVAGALVCRAGPPGWGAAWEGPGWGMQVGVGQAVTAL